MQSVCSACTMWMQLQRKATQGLLTASSADVAARNRGNRGPAPAAAACDALDKERLLKNVATGMAPPLLLAEGSEKRTKGGGGGSGGGEGGGDGGGGGGDFEVACGLTLLALLEIDAEIEIEVCLHAATCTAPCTAPCNCTLYCLMYCHVSCPLYCAVY